MLGTLVRGAGWAARSAMCTIITGMPAASAKSAEGARAPMASPSAAHVAAARLRVPTGRAEGACSTREGRPLPPPHTHIAMEGSLLFLSRGVVTGGGGSHGRYEVRCGADERRARQPQPDAPVEEEAEAAGEGCVEGELGRHLCEQVLGGA